MSGLGTGRTLLRHLARRRQATPAAIGRLEKRLVQAMNSAEWGEARRLLAQRRALPVPDEKTRQLIEDLPGMFDRAEEVGVEPGEVAAHQVPLAAEPGTGCQS